MMRDTDAERAEAPDRGAEGSAMPSVDKALRALLTLSEAGPAGLPLTELAQRLGLNKSSLHVTLGALRYRHFVTQSPETGHYKLGSTIGQLAETYFKSLDIRSILRPAILRLNQELNEVCHIALLDGTEVVYIDKLESTRAIQAGTRIGMRLPAVTTAMGRAMIACEYATFGRFAARFAGALATPTANAPQTVEAAWGRIEAARRDGYGLDLEENVLGLTAVGVAVLNGDSVAAAVSVVMLAAEQGAESLEWHAEQIRQAVGAVLTPPLRLPEPGE